MASSTSPFFMNLTDALNSRSATPSHMQHSNPLRGARHTRATAPSSASGSHSNSVNSAPSASLSQNQTHVNACNDRLPPRSLEALLQLSSNISQPPQIAVTIGTQEDDHLLVRILYESDDNGQTYRQALESLNGINGHTAAQWKDYFLDHGLRIFKLLSKYTPQPSAPVLPDAQKHATSSSVSAAPMSLSQPVAHVKHRNEQLHYIPISQGTQPAVAVARPPTQGASLSSQQSSSTHERGRFVPNTQSQHSTRDLSKSPNHPARALRPPDCDSDDERDYRPRTGGFIVPPRPDAPPTPPTRVVRTPNGKGVSFTHEDKNFFVQFILWEVGNDPTLAKVEIQRRLGEKAPHHNAISWGNYWGRHADIADKVYNAAKGMGATKRTTRAGLRRRSPAPRPPSSDREDTGSQSSSSESDDELSDWDPDADTDADIAALGGHSEPWTPIDRRVIARWIAAQPANWKEPPRRIRFAGFLRKYGCTRTLESCDNMYRSNTRGIDRLVRKYRAHLERKKSKPSPVKGEPSYISLLSEDEQDEKDDATDVPVPQVQKRKIADGDDRRALFGVMEKRRKTD